MNTQLDTVWRMAEKLTGEPIVSLQAIHKGGNNRLYRLDTLKGTRFVLKWYLKQPGDTRDRLKIECGALTFLNSHKVSQVPQLITMDPKNQCALLEWIKGSPVIDTTQTNIVSILDFVKQLQKLSDDPKAIQLPPASEACLSGNIVEQQIRHRLARIQKVMANYPALNLFIQNDFMPLFEKTVTTVLETYQKFHLKYKTDISMEHRLLSPSDFGFHNSLLREDGSLLFLDFEYFGWDDPVKMTADFLLHPGMNLAQDQKGAFIQGILEIFQGDAGFRPRLTSLFPLFALRWCMIVLNEFLPEGLARRSFAIGSEDALNSQAKQLAKAKRLLEALGDIPKGLN